MVPQGRGIAVLNLGLFGNSHSAAGATDASNFGCSASLQPTGAPREERKLMRPALLVAEHEPDSAISTRKLILETAKYNVITAHSVKEAAEALRLMSPGLAGLVLTSSLGPEDDCATLAKTYRDTKPDSPIIYLSPTGFNQCKWADHHLSTYEPDKLLHLIRNLLGDPRE